MPACHAGGRGFKSRPHRNLKLPFLEAFFVYTQAVKTNRLTLDILQLLNIKNNIRIVVISFFLFKRMDYFVNLESNSGFSSYELDYMRNEIFADYNINLKTRNSSKNFLNKNGISLYWIA